MNQIKLGTIGSGFIVHYILKGVKATEGICLEAVYSRTEEKGRELAGKYGAKKVYTDLDALLSDKEVNFIYVASPNNMHYEQARAALLQGKNVICEKPMCPRKVEAEELIALAEERGLLLIDATPTAFLPNLSIIKEKLPEIGRVRLVMSCYSQYSSRYDQLLAGNVTNVFSPEFAGGCLQDINYYNLYLESRKKRYIIRISAIQAWILPASPSCSILILSANVPGQRIPGGIIPFRFRGKKDICI